MAKNNRKEERVPARLPVVVLDPEEGKGFTRDISVSGVFFETPCPVSAGNTITFSIQITTPTGNMRLNCQGKVIRTQAGDNGLGVAVQITESALGQALIDSAMH